MSGTGPIIELGSAIVPGGPTAKARWLGPPRAAVRPKSGPGARRASAAASRSLGEFPIARALVGSRGTPRTDVTIGPARASNAPGCQPAAQRHARLGPMRSIRNWPRAAPARWGRGDRPAASGPAWPGAHRAERDSAADGVTQNRNREGKLRSSGCLALAGSRLPPQCECSRRAAQRRSRGRTLTIGLGQPWGRTAARMQHKYR